MELRDSYKWNRKWVTGVITPKSGVITYLQLATKGTVSETNIFKPENRWLEDKPFLFGMQHVFRCELWISQEAIFSYGFNDEWNPGTLELTVSWVIFWHWQMPIICHVPTSSIWFYLQKAVDSFLKIPRNEKPPPICLEKISYPQLLNHATIHPLQRENILFVKLEAARELWENADLYCGTTTRWEIQMRWPGFCRGFFGEGWKDQFSSGFSF